MKKRYKDKTIFFLLLLTTTLFGNTLTSDCSSKKEDVGCILENILIKEKQTTFKIREATANIKKETSISKDLASVEVEHKGKKISITRSIESNQKGCPPACIEEMNIEGVRTVGEIETLKFIKSLTKNGNSLVFDTRENKAYTRGTIPTALNLPAKMLEEDNKYFSEVMDILGRKRVDNRWVFEKSYDLLIFDGGITDSHASMAIKSLLKLSYPSNKIFYYRGGLKSWKELGLSVFFNL